MTRSSKKGSDMKDYLKVSAIFVVILLFTPMIIVNIGKSVNKPSLTYAIRQETVGTARNDITFNICSAKTNSKSNVEGFDFICGVVAGEVPAEFDDDALKAQAVAAFSYCCYQKTHEPDGYIDTGLEVAYLPENEAKKLWGTKFEERWSKIARAVSEVYGKALFYDGSVIKSNFCDMSSGTTESSADVFNEDLPYLVEVESSSDKLEKNYETKLTLSLSQFKSAVKKAYPEAKFDGNPSGFLSDIKRSSAGGVITAKLCGKKFTGLEIRSIFGLRSTNFTLEYNNGKFTFDVKGYGHGVGMSQRGAQYMALHGSSWQDILKWYYRGAEIGDYLDINGDNVINIKKS